MLKFNLWITSSETTFSQLPLCMINLQTLSVTVQVVWKILVLSQSSLESVLRVNRLRWTTRVSWPSPQSTSLVASSSYTGTSSLVSVPSSINRFFPFWLRGFLQLAARCPCSPNGNNESQHQKGPVAMVGQDGYPGIESDGYLGHPTQLTIGFVASPQQVRADMPLRQSIKCEG